MIGRAFKTKKAPAVTESYAPLPERVRPETFADILGQETLVGPEGILTISAQSGKPLSFILWGPPGTGKTTIARIYAKTSGLRFIPFSAVLSGIKEVKEVMADAQQYQKAFGQGTLIFVDEIHRFNKSQQDAFLPYVERGDVVLIGATTENPSFEVVSALLSRLRVFKVHPLSSDALYEILDRARSQDAWLRERSAAIPSDVLKNMAERFEGDARAALNALEAAVSYLKPGQTLDVSTVDRVLQEKPLVYDKTGEEHYNTISALHKSMRNSDADASLYWLGKMLEGGEDPKYIVRRMLRFASEDVGNADPQALILAAAVKDTVEFVGMPESNVALAQLAIYLAAAPKSNTAYAAYNAVRSDLRRGKVFPVPLQIRNAPTDLMKDFDYGKNYAYAHDEDEGVSDLQCLPEELKDRVYYTPKEIGFERTVKQRLDFYARAKARKKR